MKALTLAVALLSCASAQADDLQDRAIAGQAADVVTTTVGLTVGGLSEGNPLGIVVLPLKIGALVYADGLENQQDRDDIHRALSATGWGPAVNNICVIAAAATGGGGSAACLVAGLVAGIVDWQHTAAMRERAAFDALCEREQALNAGLVCTYTPHSVAAHGFDTTHKE